MSHGYELTDLSLALDTDGLWCMDVLAINGSKRPKQNLIEILERKGEEFLYIFLTSHPNAKNDSN